MRISSAFIVILLCSACVARANGQTRQARRDPASSVSSPGRLIEIDKARALIPDVKVWNDRGEQVRLYTDLIKNKVVLLSFFYTRCNYTCMMQGREFSKLQSALGARLGKDVFLISISMDPETDTPQKLKDWARAFRVKRGWTLVSSDSAEMSRMIKEFTGNNPGPKELHSPVMFVGNDKTGTWIAANGLSGPEAMIKLIDSLWMSHIQSGTRPSISDIWWNTFSPRLP